MGLDSGNGATVTNSDVQSILTRIDEVDDSIKAFQEQTNKQFLWVRTDLDNLRRYVKTLHQRMHDVEENLLSRPSPAPDEGPRGTPLPVLDGK